jgi:hypothetical protein
MMAGIVAFIVFYGVLMWISMVDTNRGAQIQVDSDVYDPVSGVWIKGEQWDAQIDRLSR